MNATQYDTAVAESLEAEKQAILDYQRGNLTKDELNSILTAIKTQRLALND